MTRNFTVCTPPFIYNNNKAYELVEMIEINRILGADHFVFYNYSTGNDVNEVLRHYVTEGVAQVVQWHLPVSIGVDTCPINNTPQIEVHYFAQLAMVNDCLYRNRKQSKYIVYKDLDEFVVPQQDITWSQMLAHFPTKLHIGALMFRSTYFRKEWPGTNLTFEGIYKAKKYSAVTLLKFIREKHVFPPFKRSKCIVYPIGVSCMGIHQVFRFSPGYTNVEVKPEIGLLHHYRIPKTPRSNEPMMTANTMLKYKDQLLHALDTTWARLRNVSLETASWLD
jgi:hypothetical protein